MESLVPVKKVLAVVAIGLVAGVAGCSTLSLTEDRPLQLPKDLEMKTVTPAPGTITAEIRAHGQKPQLRQLPFEQGMHVQEGLAAAGAVKRFRRMNVQVLRVVGDQQQKLEVRYKHGPRMVDPLYDYALQSGDHLIITEDTSTVINDMFSSVSGPLGRLGGK
jgi:hypothetical protein